MACRVSRLFPPTRRNGGEVPADSAAFRARTGEQSRSSVTRRHQEPFRLGSDDGIDCRPDHCGRSGCRCGVVPQALPPRNRPRKTDPPRQPQQPAVKPATWLFGACAGCARLGEVNALSGPGPPAGVDRTKGTGPAAGHPAAAERMPCVQGPDWPSAPESGRLEKLFKRFCAHTCLRSCLRQEQGKC